MFEQSPVGSQVGEETCRYAGWRLFQSEGTGCAEALVQEDLWCAQGWGDRKAGAQRASGAPLCKA